MPCVVPKYFAIERAGSSVTPVGAISARQNDRRYRRHAHARRRDGTPQCGRRAMAFRSILRCRDMAMLSASASMSEIYC